MRLDKYLAIMDLVKSRSSGVHLIKSGSVKVNGKSVLKPSYIVKEGDKIEITEKEIFVGRGGYKIRGFFEDLSEMEQDDLEIFDGLGKVNDENERSPNMQNEDDHNSKYKNLISNLIENKIILDIGCSTGGFSNFFLKNNASLVIGLDIAKEVVDLDLLKHENFIFLGGYDVLQDKIWKNKLDEVLKMRFDEISIYIHDKETVKSYYKHQKRKRNNPKSRSVHKKEGIINLQDSHATMHSNIGTFGERLNLKFELISIDVSLIKLERILPKLTPFINEDTKIICLFKPAYEGALKKVSTYEEALKIAFKFERWVKNNDNFEIMARFPSKFRGGAKDKGNQEIFYLLKCL